MTALVFWFLLRRELERRCCHGRWDPSLADEVGTGATHCHYCDTGMST